MESRIAEIEEILKGAKIIASDGDGTVSLGDTLTVESNGVQTEYQLVGAIEADPLNNKISHESPLGSALLGKKVGDTVTIKTPKGERQYTIVSLL